MTVAQLLASMPGRELTEWQAYLEHDQRVQALVQEKTDPTLAYRMVWEDGANADADED